MAFFGCFNEIQGIHVITQVPHFETIGLQDQLDDVFPDLMKIAPDHAQSLPQSHLRVHALQLVVDVRVHGHDTGRLEVDDLQLLRIIAPPGDCPIADGHHRRLPAGALDVERAADAPMPVACPR